MSVRKPKERANTPSQERKESESPKRQPTMKARAVAKLLSENVGMPVGEAMLRSGYAPLTSLKPSILTRSTQWNDLLDEYLPQGEILKTHRGLLTASNLDHMVFADGPKTDEDRAKFLAQPRNAKLKPEDVLTDFDIRELLKEKNCEVRRISRTEQSRHVYFWAADNRARKDALDMAYKLRGTYAAEKHLHVGLNLADLGKSRAESVPELSQGSDMIEID